MSRRILSHVSVGVSDIERARAFYEPVMAAIGVTSSFTTEHEDGLIAISYGESYDFWVQQPGDLSSVAVSGGAHVAFIAPSREAVHAFHAAALAHGGTDDGAPGPRPEYTPDYYAAFVKDPDGNRLEVMYVPSIHGEDA